MYKRALISISLILFILIFGVHFYFNFKTRIEPPSNEWSKEALLAEGSIQCSPKLIKFKDNYIVVYSDGKNIKVLKVNTIGIKTEEKSIPIKDGTIKDIHLFTNDNDLFMVSEIIDGKTKKVLFLKGNDTFEFKEAETIPNVSDVVQIDKYAMALSQNNKIEFINFKENQKCFKDVAKERFLMGSKNKDGYILCYLVDTGEFDYVTIKDGKISDPKLGGYTSEMTRINFLRTTMIVNDNIANVLIEYKFRDEYAGARLLTFSLNTKKYDNSEFKLNGEQRIISNIEQFSKGSENSILATASRTIGNKKVFEDIVKFDTKNGAFVNATPLSRSKEISLYANGSEDTAIFCDIIGKDNLKLYMVSTREDFKKANSTIRKDEIKLAIEDTFQSLIYSVGYIIIYGMFWILPSLFIAVILTVLEYRLNKKMRQNAFILLCIAATLIKWYFIHKISYVRYGMLLPQLLNPYVGLGICVLISFAFFMPAYFKYKKEEGYRVIMLPFSVALILESFLTVMFFGSFLV
ncbi:hypothetical protein [Clostridium omnivorum]|uniref:Uncharacterized protein n=1 Tax=Clostridium omnivorum TaxID=1604902 RepID=A0ABQ5NA34_9CLOT|nr:hypothetical protein [Clostridium sp. E14]GLC32042.1 hypothetical protein bsdE14_34520 [Clostridium sp. E14]